MHLNLLTDIRALDIMLDVSLHIISVVLLIRVSLGSGRVGN